MLCFIRKTTILNTLALCCPEQCEAFMQIEGPTPFIRCILSMVPSWMCLTFAIVFFPGCRGAWCNSNQYMPIVDLRFWKGHTQVSPKCLIIGCWLVSFNDSRNRNMSLHILIASPHVIFCGWTSGWIFLGAFQACAAVACVHAVLSVASCVCCVVWHKWPHFMKRPRSQGLEHLYKQIISVASVAWRFLSTTKIHPSRN